LLQMGVDRSARESMMQATPLMYAASAGETGIVKILIQAGADVNEKDEYGGTALIRAADSGHREMVEYLLDEGAEIDAMERGSRFTALFKAVSAGHLSIVQLLVERGADVRFRMRGNLTAAQWARRYLQCVQQHTPQIDPLPETAQRAVRGAELILSDKQSILACADYLEQREDILV